MRRMLDSREVSAEELARAHLDRISRLDPAVRAFITVCEDRTLTDAAEAQKQIDGGGQGALTGIPVALKDNMITKGVRTTCASRILEKYVPPFEGTAAERLRRAGAVLLGKTNLDEFAMGSSTEYSAFFTTRNPWDLERVPGGSSGGSAAAVASGMAPIAYGSDTGGSVRQPAALCGVVGLKPTYGRISRYGLVAFSSSLDQIGPFGRSVEDVICAFEAVMGRDPHDSTTVDMPYDGSKAREPVLKGRRIGVPSELLSGEIAPDVSHAVRAALDLISDAGGETEEVSLPMIEHGVATYYIIAPAEASSNLARYDGVRYGLRIDADDSIEMMKGTRSAGFGSEVTQRIMIGTYVLSAGYYDAFYTKAHQARTIMKRQFQEAFRKFDLLIAPTSPVPAFRLGERLDDPMAMKLADFCTIPANIGGFPAISLNCGFSNGLPIGVQLIADSFQEETLFSVALALENLLPPFALPEIEVA